MNKKPILVDSTSFDISMFEVDKDKGLVNLTKIAQYFGKDVYDWKRLPNTVRYLEALEAKDPLRDNLVVVNGGVSGNGTWASKQIARKFASWISIDFELYLDEKIDELFTKGYTSIDNKPRVTIEEAFFINDISEDFQYLPRIQSQINKAVVTIKQKEGVWWDKANKRFDDLAGYNLLSIREDYENFMANIGEKPKRDNRINMIMVSSNWRFARIYLTALSINRDQNYYHLADALNEYVKQFGLTFTADDYSTPVVELYKKKNVKELSNKNKTKIN